MDYNEDDYCEDKDPYSWLGEKSWEDPRDFHDYYDDVDYDDWEDDWEDDDWND